ncbi:polyadenylate-binding protein-interacting protein 5-like [Cajanus cajan]|uniref:polyadenylate-binding protein-interacting protein 5-like n=1 Tax=Cajanus cajan TaxID=3821 RepID=UPI00098D9687|nr:polyadenylate-binding protein-interacting protein 5-like [Cajanus cajan]
MAGRSSLNPHAASFVPRSGNGFKNHDEAPYDDHHEHLLESNTESIPESLQENTNPAAPCTSSSHNVTEDDENVDIGILKMTFPDIHVQSLRDLYMINHSDLDDTLDMLWQLESDDLEAFDTLEHLSINDHTTPSESAPASDSASADVSTESKPATSANE